MVFKWRSTPERGYRFRRRFAFFPRHLGNDKYVWGQFYYSLQKEVRWNFGGRISVDWITIERQIKSIFTFRLILKKRNLFVNKYRRKQNETIANDIMRKFFEKS